MSSPSPTRKQRRLHVAVVSAAAVVAVLMVAAAAWSLTRPEPQRALLASSLTKADETSAAAVATVGLASGGAPAAEPTASAAATAPASPTNQAAPTDTSVIVSAHMIAYRVSGALYVAKEDGTAARPVFGNGSKYALSPDGVRVASVENGKLAVVAVGARPTAEELTPGTVCDDGVVPVWTPDSSAVMFIKSDSNSEPAVWRYNVGTEDLTKIGSGAGMAISPNGLTIVTLPGDDAASNRLRVWRVGGSSYTIKSPPGAPSAVALTNSRIIVSTDSATDGSASLWSLSLDGKQRKKLAGGSSAGDAEASYAHLLPSPDGKRVLYSVDGDDGYSRMRVVPSGGGAVTTVSGRRDGYPLTWTADSKRILFIEGNAIQLETTALWRCDYEGQNRKRLVKNATI